VKKISKTRGTVWTDPMPDDADIQFEVRPLTPILQEQIQNKFLHQRLVHSENGKSQIETEITGHGLVREQAKHLVVNWKGFIYGEDMGPLAGTPMPFTEKNADLVFDQWDDGSMATFVNKAASNFATIREANLKNSEPRSATA
jgi:hypothetical protein